jgi:hypothetical protein
VQARQQLQLRSYCLAAFTAQLSDVSALCCLMDACTCCCWCCCWCSCLHSFFSLHDLPLSRSRMRKHTDPAYTAYCQTLQHMLLTLACIWPANPCLQFSAAAAAAAAAAGEQLWRLPLNRGLTKKLDSPIADMKNYAGAHTARGGLASRASYTMRQSDARLHACKRNSTACVTCLQTPVVGGRTFLCTGDVLQAPADCTRPPAAVELNMSQLSCKHPHASMMLPASCSHGERLA